MKIKDLRVWLVLLLMLTIGFGLLVIDEKFYGATTHPLTSSILNRTSTAIIVTGFFTLINNLLLRQSLIDLIYEKINFKYALEDVGVIDLYTDLRDFEYTQWIVKAHDINIAHVYGQTWTSMNKQTLIEAIQKNNCKVTVILLSQNSSFIKPLAEYYGYSESKLRNKIMTTEEEWKATRAKLKGKSAKNRLNVYSANMFPAYSMYRFDKVLVKVDNRLISEEKGKLLNIAICQDIGEETSYYSNCMRDFSNLVKHSTTKKLFN